MGARKVGDKAFEWFGNNAGTITAVREEAPGVFEYSIEWDDGNYAGETWSEQDLEPLPEGD